MSGKSKMVANPVSLAKPVNFTPIVLRNENGWTNLAVGLNQLLSVYSKMMDDARMWMNLSSILQFQQTGSFQNPSFRDYWFWAPTPDLSGQKPVESPEPIIASQMAPVKSGAPRISFPILSGATSDWSVSQSTQKTTPEKPDLEPESDREVSKEDSVGSTSNKGGSKSDNLLETHPYEIKYIFNKKTNRKLKRMVCKFENCNKVFEKKWNFKDHIRMHRGQTPYKCSTCGKSFTQKGNLVKHQRQHIYKSLKSRKREKCKYCSKSFTEKYNLKVLWVRVLISKSFSACRWLGSASWVCW